MRALQSEKDLEIRLRKKLKENFWKSDFVLLENKDIVDLIILNDKKQKLFFIELKFFIKSHSRLGVGSRNGTGFQIEILKSKFKYFESNLRWVLATENDGYFRFCTNEQIRNNICNGLDIKFNSISKTIFENSKIEKLNEETLLRAINNWLNS